MRGNREIFSGKSIYNRETICRQEHRISEFISYIFIDASGWVISDVSFGFMGGFGSSNIRSSHPNDPVGIGLTPTPIPAANLRIHTRRKKCPQKRLYK